MKSNLNPLLWALLLAMGCTGANDATGTPPRVEATDRLRLVIDGWLDLTDVERFIVPGDSMVVRAVVDGNAAAYEQPVITASDTSAVTVRADGSLAVRHGVSGLVISATAKPRAPISQQRTLSASGRLNVACTAIAIAGISVTLLDSLTGTAPTGTGTVRFKAWSATYADSLNVPALLTSWATAWERTGFFSVTVDADGFAPWRRDGIEVTRGICHVRPVSVQAKLQRR